MFVINKKHNHQCNKHQYRLTFSYTKTHTYELMYENNRTLECLLTNNSRLIDREVPKKYATISTE